jgi:hypothetical protein
MLWRQNSTQTVKSQSFLIPFQKTGILLLTGPPGFKVIKLFVTFPPDKKITLVILNKHLLASLLFAGKDLPVPFKRAFVSWVLALVN